MSLASLEREIVAEARIVLHNPKFRLKDLYEWSSGDVKVKDGEGSAYLPVLKLWIAYPAACDKRKP